MLKSSAKGVGGLSREEGRGKSEVKKLTYVNFNYFSFRNRGDGS